MTEKDIEFALLPYLRNAISIPPNLYSQLSMYLHLLLKWNARTNLTAIREPEEIVRRHFGESLFAAQHLGKSETLLDFGSGAGFPGLPIQLLLPALRVTLAESQNKKASFLREVVRTLGLKTEVWPGRVEAMPESRRFDVVSLRAVDAMEVAVEAASIRASGQIVLLTTSNCAIAAPNSFVETARISVPDASSRQIVCLDRQPSGENVPRGTF